MDIQHKRVDHRGKFYMADGTSEIAKMTYVFAGDTKFIIDHTEVEEGHKGEGLGEKLVEAGVKFARDNNLKILPLCPFAKSVFDKRSDLADVLS